MATVENLILKRSTYIVFYVSFLAYAFVGWVGAYVLQTYNWDGLARIAQAHGVLFGRDPHLAAIGFVWPPLPVLTDIPLVFVLKPVGLVLLAGPLMSALYGAFGLAQLWEVLQRFGLPPLWRWIWVAAFGLHPLIVQNATMGLSEAPFLAFLLLSLNGFMMWEQTGRPAGLIWAGVGAALAVYCRYEALAWVAAMVVAIAWQLRLKSHSLFSQVTVGSVVAFAAPPLWALMVWAFVNWQIMGNPIHFLVGQGSTSTTPDTAQAVGPAHPFAFAQGSVIGAIILLWRQVIDLAPLVLPATALLVLCVFWRRRWADMVYLALAWSILGFVFLIAFRGLLPSFTRYFFWVVPAGVIVAGAMYRSLPSTGLLQSTGLQAGVGQALQAPLTSAGHNGLSSQGIGAGYLRHIAAAGVALLLALPSLSLPLQAWPRLSDPMPQRVAGALLLPPEVSDARQVRGQLDVFEAAADYLNAQPPGTLTLLDAAVAGPIVFYAKRPHELVMTTDRDFLQILQSPVGRVDQILVPFPSFDAIGRSDIVKYYPNLYENGEPWARLAREFLGPSPWKLYEVVR